LAGLENLPSLLVLQTKKIEKEEVRQTVSGTSPIQLNIGAEQKRKYLPQPALFSLVSTFNVYFSRTFL
jgi:hypothetical protein